MCCCNKLLFFTLTIQWCSSSHIASRKHFYVYVSGSNSNFAHSVSQNSRSLPDFISCSYYFMYIMDIIFFIYFVLETSALYFVSIESYFSGGSEHVICCCLSSTKRIVLWINLIITMLAHYFLTRCSSVLFIHDTNCRNSNIMNKQCIYFSHWLWIHLLTDFSWDFHSHRSPSHSVSPPNESFAATSKTFNISFSTSLSLHFIVIEFM